MTSPAVETASVDATHIDLDHDNDNDVSMQAVEDIRYKSWRKKYRKMKVKFDESMDDANELFIHEHKAWEIARRIQEQNDQLLDILHDLEQETTPPDGQSLIDKLSTTLASLAATTTHTSPAILSSSLNIVPPLDLLDLPSHLLPSTHDDPASPLPPGYLTTDHECAYLSALDASLTALPSTDHLPHTLEPIHPSSALARDKQPLRETDFARQNPISVYNWLRKNKPEYYVEKGAGEKERGQGQGHLMERVVERSDRSVGGRSPGAEVVKKGRRGKGEEEEAGGEGSEGGVLGKGKRKRDDETYRPKGGHSRLMRRKKERVSERVGERGERKERSKLESVVKAEDLEEGEESGVPGRESEDPGVVGKEDGDGDGDGDGDAETQSV